MSMFFSWRKCSRACGATVSAALFFGSAGVVSATQLIDSSAGELHLDFQVGAGAYHSRRNYQQSGFQTEGSSTWQEGYIKLGLRGTRNLAGGSRLYGGVTGLTKGTFGDGDPAGWTSGHERRTALSEAYVGWRSGDLFPSLGK